MSLKHDFTHYRGEWILLLATLAAAFGWLFSKSAIAELPAVTFVSLRFGAAALIFLPFAFRGLGRLSRKQWQQSLLVGLSFSLYLFFWVLGVKHTQELGKGAFLLSLAMLAAPLIAWLIYQERPIRRFWLALPIAVLGMIFLAASGLSSGGGLGLDTLFFLLTALWAGIQFVLNSRCAKSVPILPLTFIQLAMVGLSSGFYALLAEDMPSSVGSMTWLWLALSVLIGTNARFLLQTFGQKLSDVGNGALIMILEPVWTMLLSVMFMQEMLGTSKIIGCVLILLALLLYRVKRLPKTASLHGKKSRKQVDISLSAASPCIKKGD
ncbi:DMT family transporter [Avibacterium sp. 21-599]|uniref:DMT family transporter n=1 Tax=Avibacterium sp. 21-599 TaxID=2911528 RepID=UPI0022466DC7|nr:DMT family transporter [Avibacterium sp. 21-599]MCW9717531.1 DMT family transporter [Avibacterium sp. 21-599]